MAIVPSTKYSGQVDTSDLTAYPHGKAQNVTVAGDGTGTPLEQDWVNDLWGFLQALLDRAGITPSTFPDKVGTSDYLDALDEIYSGSVSPIRVVGMLAADWEFESGQVMLTSDAGLGSLVDPRGCAFNATGDRLFQCNTTDNEIYEYDLSVRWDISSATYSAVSYDTSAEVTSLHSIAWKPDGTAFYVTDFGGTGDAYQYTCSTPYSLASGVSYATKTLDTNTETALPASIQFSSDGATAWIAGAETVGGELYEYTLGTNWDLGTATYSTDSINLYDSGAGPWGLSAAFWSADGLRVLAIGHSSGGTAVEYRNWIANSPWGITSLNSLGSKVTDTNWPSAVNGVGAMPDGSRVILNLATDDDSRAFRVNHLARGH